MSEFEFGEDHNRVITQFSEGLYYMSIALVVTGVLTLGSSFLSEFYLPTIILGFAWLAMGAGFFFPVDNFRNIVHTEGSDITELMTGFREIRSGWILVGVILILYLFLKVLDLAGVL